MQDKSPTRQQSDIHSDMIGKGARRNKGHLKGEALRSDRMREKHKASILYVEDEAITRMTVHKMLQARYTTIYQASDGREGLELFKLHHPDVVITDTRMPLMDGIHMTKAIRELNPDIPIIFITANEDAEFVAETKKLNVTRNLIKPIVLKDLFAILENILGCQDANLEGTNG
jgi:YesN/AraC family two-component response regulator